MDRESAVALIRSIKEAQEGAFAIMPDVGKGASSRERSKALFEAEFEIAAEFGFADNVAYASFPELWREERRRSPKDDARTDESDAAFRKNAVPPCSVRFTRAARAQTRRFLISVRSETGRDHVLAVS